MMWTIWLAIGAGMEAFCAATHRPTFSRHIWNWADEWWKKGILLTFMIWLTLHLVWRI